MPTERRAARVPRFLGSERVDELLLWPELIDAIEQIVVAPGTGSPERTVHTVPVEAGSDASLLLKPGWIVGDVIVVKAVTFFPDNGEVGLPTVDAGVLVFDGRNGTFLGACDGSVLTTRRTAAASAVAAKRLARRDAERLLVVGTGALAPMVAQAHAAVRNYRSIVVWGRSGDAARRVSTDLAEVGLPASDVDDLDAAVGSADVITCVTGATSPLIRGALLKAGTHVDLVGAFTSEMRESDDDVVRRATIFTDTRTDGIVAGDLAQPLASGLITLDDIAADLSELVAGTHPGRMSDDEITMFKSAGFALEDVAAAQLVFASEGCSDGQVKGP